MDVILFLVFHLLWKCAQPQSVEGIDIDFDIYIESLSEYDEDDERVLSNSYTDFAPKDWLNQSVFDPILSNYGSLRMSIELLPPTHELQYSIRIHHWPWHNRNNSIEFCFHVFIPHANGLQFQCSHKASLEMEHDNINVCHHFYSEELFHVAHIYYNTETNHNPTILAYYNSTGHHNHSQEVLYHDVSPTHTQHDQNMWLFGVSLAIATVLCSFALLITYLIKMGFFQDAPKRHAKRKKSTIIIGMGKRSSTNSSTVSSPPSPKKNLRINVTYHNSATPQNMGNAQGLAMVRHHKKKSKSSCSLQSMEMSGTHTCDTTRILQYLPEGDEDEDEEDETEEDEDDDEEEEDEDEDDEELETLTRHICDDLEHSLMPSTIVTPTVHSRNDTEMDSMIQYIITASNDSTPNDAPSPVPFV